MSNTGWLDSASYTGVSGWATAPVSILVNGAAVATVTPNIQRPDLPAGALGFNAPIDPLQLLRGDNEIAACFADSGVRLGKGPKTLRLEVSPGFIAGFSMANIARGLWALDNIRPRDDTVTLDGWYAPPPGVAEAALFADGEMLRFESRRDAMLQARMWLPPEVPVFRYEATFRQSAPELNVSFGTSRRAFNSQHDYIVPRELAPQPGRGNISRVSGGGNALKFDANGRSVAARLRTVFETYGRAPLSEAAVLDWGVGAGRMARFIAPHAGAFYGADIDADNLAWCRDNLAGEYAHIAPEPPTPLPSGRFDFIYGISVLSHLTRAHETAWLRELRRLVRPDGLVALSIMGPTSLMVMGMAHVQAQLYRDGFVDLGENKVLTGHVPDGYYRNVTQSFAHLHQVWGEAFEIEAVLPAAISNFQDLVVMRPR